MKMQNKIFYRAERQAKVEACFQDMLTYLKTKEAEEVPEKDLEVEMGKKYSKDVIDTAIWKLMDESGHTEEWEIGTGQARFFYLSPEKRKEVEGDILFDIHEESEHGVYKTASVEGAD